MRDPATMPTTERRTAWLLTWIGLGLMSLAASRAVGDEASSLSLEREAMALLKARCVKCHGPIKPKGGLNLSSPRALARGGENGPAIEPGTLENSALWEQTETGEMPPKPEEPLSADERAVLRRWIEGGAPGLPSAAEIEKTPPGADHWAFAPLKPSEPPAVKHADWPRNPIDRFILATLEGRGLALSPEADRATLARRVTLDLTGLPPTIEEVEGFIADRRPDAYERLVDRLLASPHYGERWGKFWLDAAGYVESNGYFSADSERPLAWKYRDYVVRAFNADRPLDQIVREQLAGDELSGYKPGMEVTPEIIDQLVATHFLRNAQDGTGESDGNADEVRADKVAVLDGAVQIIGSSLLGMTFQCAKCHDHKFEPFTQKEYYQLHAILYPAFNVDKWVKPNDRTVDAATADVVAPWQAHELTIDAEVARLKREHAPRDKDAPAEKEARKKAIDEAVKAAESRRRPHPGKIAWVADLPGESPPAPLLIRGDPSHPGDPVGPGGPAFLSDPDDPFEPRPTARNGTGRRTAFAQWLTKPGSRPSALLARILVNRIWQNHFGVGLVATSDNLGYTGSPPTHPALLEHLAAELVRSGWRAKSVHRLIVGSAVYRQSSAARADVQKVDPENRLLGRFPTRRLDAEALRDAWLAVSGDLDTRLGGPSTPTQRTESGEVTPIASEGRELRRSVYLQTRRTQVASLLEVFDAPSIVAACTRRASATIPLQSLSLLNSDFVVDRARRLAERLDRECGPAAAPEARIDRAFLLCVSRGPTPEERAAAVDFLQAQPARYPGATNDEARRRTWVDFSQMLLASNAFLYVE
ncbi:MAG: PSD1 and planctomycete cytochrome C domain-containing protein [Paludisphaera borealis]|uniref:PSD1 and planctomycete cytochrome C domain-containing protein n=1 Tax=Paludisphaera borealis TaxID=1387353 RepID=UPI002841F570|nr:PSD1 and planctomycete cytochrome C domain-containing protein [Paludisphaera borealis]MDR3618375.1 PSD1 and planctomycete cytochrome C domain-containing protein [Paludisphaera borealis]